MLSYKLKVETNPIRDALLTTGSRPTPLKNGNPSRENQTKVRRRELPLGTGDPSVPLDNLRESSARHKSIRIIRIIHRHNRRACMCE